MTLFDDACTLPELATLLYALHRRKQRFGATGLAPSELRQATEQVLALVRQPCEGNQRGSPGGPTEGPRQPLPLFVEALCTCLSQPGSEGAAVPKLQAAVKLQPGLLQAWLVLAHCAYEQGDVSHAISCLLRGLRLHQQAQAAAASTLDNTEQQHECPAPQAAGPCADPGSPGASSTGAGAGTSDSLLQAAATRQTGSGGGVSAAASSSPVAPISTAGAGGGSAGAAVAGVDSLLSMPTSSLAADREAVKEGMQLLSMLVRQQQQQQHASAGGEQDRRLLPPDPREALTHALELSRDLANAALEMDVSDAYSWYVLALAELSAYLQAPLLRPGTASSRPRHLQRLLASFSQAERHGLSDLADLYFNRATLHTFCQRFPEALADYERAQALDPTLPVARQVESLMALLSQLSSLVQSRGGIKAKQWGKVTALLAKDTTKAHQLLSRGLLHHQPGLMLVGAGDLSPGHNRGAALLCRPLVFISPPLNASASLYIVCVDTSACCVALALVRIPHNAFSMNQQLTIVNPELLNVRVMQRGKELAFPLVKVDSASDSVLLVDGVPVQPE